jgi:hypothetical protein
MLSHKIQTRALTASLFSEKSSVFMKYSLLLLIGACSLSLRAVQL